MSASSPCRQDAAATARERALKLTVIQPRGVFGPEVVLMGPDFEGALNPGPVTMTSVQQHAVLPVAMGFCATVKGSVRGDHHSHTDLQIACKWMLNAPLGLTARVGSRMAPGCSLCVGYTCSPENCQRAESVRSRGHVQQASPRECATVWPAPKLTWLIRHEQCIGTCMVADEDSPHKHCTCRGPGTSATVECWSSRSCGRSCWKGTLHPSSSQTRREAARSPVFRASRTQHLTSGHEHL